MPRELSFQDKLSLSILSGRAVAPLDPDPVGVYRMSETGLCQRKIVYARTNTPKSNRPEPYELERMDKGDALHDYIRNVVIPTYTGYQVIEQEDELHLGQDGIIFDGHTDGLLATKPKSKRIKPKPIAILEVKTMSDWGFKEVEKRNFEDPTHYSMGYVRQGNRYCAAKRKKYPDLNMICILCYNCDGKPSKVTQLPFRDYWFHFDQEALDRDIEQRIQLEKGIKDGHLPPRYYPAKGDWGCKICSWRDRCWDVDGTTLPPPESV